MFCLFFCVTPAIPFIFLNRRLYFRWCSLSLDYALQWMTCLLEDLLGIKLVLTGDDLTKNKQRSLIMTNHPTRLDWMYVWTIYSRFQALEQFKIALKSEMKHIPFVGWILQHAAFLFVERSWEKDQQNIPRVINYYKSCQSPISLLFFPEGTNLRGISKARSNDYASKQTTYNKPYDYCLHPRLTGFIYLLNTMRSNNLIDTVDDVTIGYEGKYPVTEVDLFKGDIPKVVHFHIKRYNVNDLPKEDEKLGKWLQKCWDEKENRLKEFYTNYQFDSPSKRINLEEIAPNIRFQHRLTVILWILYILFWSYCFIAYTEIKIYVLIVFLFHLVFDKFTDGIINFVCRIQENSQRKQAAIKQD